MTVGELIAELSQIEDLNIPIVIIDNCNGAGMCFLGKVGMATVRDENDLSIVCCLLSHNEKG